MASNAVKLVVKDAFDGYIRGDEITDPNVIKSIIGTERENSVLVIPANNVEIKKEG